MDEAIRGDIERACIKMGVLDKRTVRKHLARFDACLADFLISLAGMISDFGEDLPDRKPEKCNLVEKNIIWFRELVLNIISIRERLFGFENLSGKEIAALLHFFIHPIYPAASCINTGHKIYSIFLRSPP